MPLIPSTYPECVCMCVCVCVCVCMCMCVSICMCVCMHVCMCMYVYTQTLQHGEVHKYLCVIRGNMFYVQTNSLLDCVVYLCSPLPLLFPLFCPFFPLSASSPPPLPYIPLFLPLSPPLSHDMQTDQVHLYDGTQSCQAANFVPFLVLSVLIIFGFVFVAPFLLCILTKKRWTVSSFHSLLHVYYRCLIINHNSLISEC